MQRPGPWHFENHYLGAHLIWIRSRVVRPTMSRRSSSGSSKLNPVWHRPAAEQSSLRQPRLPRSGRRLASTCWPVQAKIRVPNHGAYHIQHAFNNDRPAGTLEVGDGSCCRPDETAEHNSSSSGRTQTSNRALATSARQIAATRFRRL